MADEDVKDELVYEAAWRVHVDVCSIGAGASGIAMAYHLQEAGIESFVVLEKRHEVGGTWSTNTYPGCGCDVPSHLYSFSFAPKPDWSRFYPPQKEILAYMKKTVDHFGLKRYIRLSTEVIEAVWRNDLNRWAIFTRATGPKGFHGYYLAKFLIVGAGLFGIPRYPAEVPGFGKFEGPAFHTSDWDHSVDLTDKRVVVIGNGASAIQLVPKIQPIVSHLTIFQRTPAWIYPKHDFQYSESTKRFLSHHPLALRALRYQIYLSYQMVLSTVVSGSNRVVKLIGESRCKSNMKQHIMDPNLRKALTPNYTLGCKRMLVSSDYYPTLVKPNVTLVTSGISAITHDGAIDNDKKKHGADVIIYGTGFKVIDFLSELRVVGVDGTSLYELWKGQGHPYAYLGMTVLDFPNFFLLYGPNTNLGHNSVLFMVEAQCHYIVSTIKQMRDLKATSLNLKPRVQQEYQKELARRSGETVFLKGGCNSYYIQRGGTVDDDDDEEDQICEEIKVVNPTNWPGTVAEYQRRTRRVNLERDYDLTYEEKDAGTV